MVDSNHEQRPGGDAAPSVVSLVGYRGTGKSTVARLLAEQLGWHCADADEVLETRYGQTIRAIFAQEGEGGFRAKEAAVLQELCTRQRHVLALGGGVILRAENREILRQTGLVVWLTADPRTLWQRLQQCAATAERRPNLSGGGLAEIEELLRVRQPLYAQCADLAVDTVGRSPLEVAEAIVGWLLSERRGSPPPSASPS